LVGLLALPFLVPQFQRFLIAETLLLILLATAFNLLYGYTGLLSFGHAMFIALPGYTFAIFVLDVVPEIGLSDVGGGANPLVLLLIGFIVAMVITFIITVPIGYLSVQLREIYFAMITLSFSMAIFAIADRNIGGLSNGDDGRTVILSQTELFGLEFSLIDPLAMYFIILLFFVPAMYLMWRIVNSPFGQVCKAIRENPERASAIGINVTKHSWYTFILSGMFSAIAGVFIVPLRTFINPAVANWSFGAEPVIMTVLGGPYNFLGPAIGAVVFRYARWFLSQYPVLEANWELFLGTIVLVMVLFFSGGISEGVKKLIKRVRNRQSESSPSESSS
jgi:branched-chain amino acid transport system permease protein